MKRSTRFPHVAVAVLAAALVAGCASSPSPAEVYRHISQLPTKSLSDYQFDPATKLIDRVGVPSAAFMRSIGELDHTDTYTAYTPTPAELALLQKNLDLLPASYRRVLDERLVAIYFVNNFKGSGMTDYVLDENKRLYATLTLNPETMRHDISDWMTYRESTCFTASAGRAGGIEVRVNAGRRYSGLTYVLLHETSHIVDYVQNLTPYVDSSILALGLSVAPTAFTSPVWSSYDRARPDSDFALRKQIHFYGFGPPLPVSQAERLYRGLAASPFASLYGSENWAEDFAEYVTWYYLTQCLRQPYMIEVYAKGRLTFEYEPMRSTRVLERARAISSLFTG